MGPCFLVPVSSLVAAFWSNWSLQWSGIGALCFMFNVNLNCCIMTINDCMMYGYQSQSLAVTFCFDHIIVLVGERDLNKWQRMLLGNQRLSFCPLQLYYSRVWISHNADTGTFFFSFDSYQTHQQRFFLPGCSGAERCISQGCTNSV